MEPAAAALEVYERLIELGGRRSNPVLEVLPVGEPVVVQRHYPDPYLGFAAGALRAYYHCHPEPTRFSGEHGHFHLFAELAGDGSWTHLAALTMDPQGQPLRWAATNRWVTDEHWLAAAELVAVFDTEIELDSLSTVERWLYAMVMLHREELGLLWRQRDLRLTEVMAKTPQTDMLDDHGIYLWAERPIDLMAQLQKAWPQEPAR